MHLHKKSSITYIVTSDKYKFAREVVNCSQACSIWNVEIV